MNYKEVIESRYSRQNWQLLLHDIFGNKIKFWGTPSEVHTSSQFARQAFWLGTITLSDEQTISVYEVELADSVDIERNRRGIRDMLLTDWRNNGNAGAFMFCYRKNESVLRFSYVSESWKFAEDGTYQKESTDTKRFTYLLGEGHRSRTAIQQFETLKTSALSLKDLTKAFSVDAVSDMFFNDYKKQYEDIIAFVTGKRMVKESNKWEEKIVGAPCNNIIREFSHFQNPEKAIRDYVKKLMGRIVFIQFLQKKGWMGVPVNKDWGEGDAEFVMHLFEQAKDKDHFIDEVLEPLFNDLNTERVDDLSTLNVQCKVPYLNGGLFEREATDETLFPLPAKYMQSMLDFFASYNFTIDENDPDDAEVGVDPEMLGRIFENLLEDNKDKGAFYTPKEIVQYMCRESLIAYLQTDIEKDEQKEAIRHFVSQHQIVPHLPSDILDMLKKVKICDPAIGSGAFPMGLLKELFLCRLALQEFDDSSAAEIKKHIIQQNIYGVDIESGAVDIARLRFWLSLIVDEETPQALPNLDFKIMQGNSLLEQYQGFDLSTVTEKNVNKADGLTLFDDMLDVYRKELRDKLSQYYGCTNSKEKKQLKKDIVENVKKQLAEIGIELEVGDPDLSGNDQFILWHTWFYDVFSQGGFDIVIGNPPYIQLQNNGGELAKLYEDCKYMTFARTGDIYCLFYERGWQLLKKNGHLCYITSNKWMRAGYGEKTRDFFANKTNPMLLIDFAGVKIFESATVDTNILLFSKSNNQHETVCAVTNKQNKDSVKNLSDFVQQQNSICDFATSDSWVILSPIEQSIKKKIEAVGTPLKDWDINIYRGVLTGCNEAFIIDSQKRDEILANCQTEDERKRTAELIRPILRGRDIKRYGYDWANLYLIATFPSRHYDIDKYPSIKQYLLSFGIERLEQTGKTHIINGEKVKARKKTNNKWFETQDSISYWEDFSKPKVVYMEIQTDNPEEGYPFPCYSYDNNQCIVLNTAYIMSSNSLDPRYVLGILNSSLGKFLVKLYVTQLQERQFRMLSQYVMKFPIARPSKEHEMEMIRLVQEILSHQVKTPESRIDELSFQIYKLSETEIKFLTNK